MTLSAGTSIGKPRIFIDYISFLRSQGAITGYDGSPDVWDMNPTKITTANQYNRVKFEDNNDEIDSFIGTANYFAVLGHNATGNDFFVRKYWTFDDSDDTVDNYAPRGVSYDLPGYKIDLYPDGISGSGNYFNAKAIGSDKNVGSFSVGRYFDFSHAVDLDVSYSVSHDGIKTKRTIGGRDITNINYHSQPLWGDRKPWTSGETYKYTGYNGRRSWKVSFSYIDHDSSLPQNMNEDFMINNQMLSPELGMAHTTENIVSHFLTLTLGGSLKFIFQPDVNLDQFSLCRLSKPQTTFKQVAHKTYNISFTFVETY
tara:strand:- start:3880 stop:4818 length:939 start_codon:yes stop_codon:yes gene_type:complete